MPEAFNDYYLNSKKVEEKKTEKRWLDATKRDMKTAGGCVNDAMSRGG